MGANLSTRNRTHRGEGLVIKRNDAHYVLNGREDSWIKVKPGESPSLVLLGPATLTRAQTTWTSLGRRSI